MLLKLCSMKAVAEHCSRSLGRYSRRRYSSASASRDSFGHGSLVSAPTEHICLAKEHGYNKMAMNFCHVKIPLITVHSTL